MCDFLSLAAVHVCAFTFIRVCTYMIFQLHSTSRKMSKHQLFMGFKRGAEEAARVHSASVKEGFETRFRVHVAIRHLNVNYD